MPVPRLLPSLMQGKSEAASTPDPSLLVVGNVDFEASPGVPPKRTTIEQLTLASRRAVRTDRRGNRFGPLPGTDEEARKIYELFARTVERESAQTAQLSGTEATESAFRQRAPGQRYLHVATHGYFAPAELVSALRSSTEPPRTSFQSIGNQNGLGRRPLKGHHPGLLSGLVFAGANRSDPAAGTDSDDGILTALEVAAMDLRQTDLVVLSACETGLGRVAGGEGVLGLQRAFQMSGAKTAVTSLWKVDDRATQTLMVEFYRNLWERKLPKLEALRQAQLKMLRHYDSAVGQLRDPGGRIGAAREPEAADDDSPSQSRTPPAYWAPWVLSGDPGKLSSTADSTPTDLSPFPGDRPPAPSRSHTKTFKTIGFSLAFAILVIVVSLIFIRRRACSIPPGAGGQ